MLITARLLGTEVLAKGTEGRMGMKAMAGVAIKAKKATVLMTVLL